MQLLLVCVVVREIYYCCFVAIERLFETGHSIQGSRESNIGTIVLYCSMMQSHNSSSKQEVYYSCSLADSCLRCLKTHSLACIQLIDRSTQCLVSCSKTQSDGNFTVLAWVMISEGFGCVLALSSLLAIYLHFPTAMVFESPLITDWCLTILSSV